MLRTYRQSGKNITAEGQGITVVDFKTGTPNKSLEVKEKQVAKHLGEDGKGSLDQFKDLSKTSAKSSYPEVVTEPSHQVNCS